MSDFAASAVPLTGGYGGQTYAVSAGGEDAVLKLYVKDPGRAAVDAALLRLVHGLLPVPRILDAKREGSPDDPPYLLTERLPGINLQVFLETAGEDERRTVGRQLGELLVRLSGMPFLTFGEFRDGDLAIEPFGFGDLEAFFQSRDLGFDQKQVEGFGQVIRYAEDVQAEGVDRVCLVHSDFNPKNLLVDPATARLTGLIDWEFAHAGSPYTDLGNLFRFCDDPVLAGAVLSVVRGSGLDLGEPLVDLGRAADLWALLELAARSAEHEIAAAAHALVSRMADTGTLAGGRVALDVVH
ncbi:aminoglycoside phosphotransferase (APT) family kinase protein [Kribbella steppae]|uniref:Aminoglycoside phosphotransferase (APT) family kinase protein n=1 Tax=Kribbella steppae TaxID=2512223 RepID=A0A4R2H8R5_9ACTN|nr:phosphotransferase [Kribbella steppae]TCO23308.1 aminoglycoside phosphotransferase (APT) family kinase protein [Kribbella steppae]